MRCWNLHHSKHTRVYVLNNSNATTTADAINDATNNPQKYQYLNTRVGSTLRDRIQSA